MTLEQLIASCIEARKQFERAEVDYFEFLRKVEAEHESTWKAGCGTFESFLQTYVGLPRPSRYADFRASLKAIGIEKVREMGVDGAFMSLQASSKKAQGKYEEAAKAWVKTHKGVHPSREEAKKLLRQVDPRPETPKALGQLQELETLRVECDRLKRENHRLERELEKVKAENARLKGKTIPDLRA